MEIIKTICQILFILTNINNQKKLLQIDNQCCFGYNIKEILKRKNKILSKHKPKPIYTKNENIIAPCIDSHAHLDRFDNFNDIITNAKNDGLEAIVTMAGEKEVIKFAQELTKTYPHIYYAIGLHPYDIHLLTDEYINDVKKIAQNDKKFILVGEFGLDYHGEMPHTIEEQKEAFIKQLKMASQIKKPIALHIRDAHEDAIQILKENKNLLTSGGIIHCFSGGEKEAREYLSLGFHLSFSGAVTYHKDGQETDLVKALKVTPLDKLLVETDAPFLAPSPYRGIINEPKYVLVTVEHIADLLRMDTNELIKITNNNTKKLLKIK